MRFTIFGYSPKDLEEFQDEPDSFKFILDNYSFHCSLSAAKLIAPIVAIEMAKNPDFNSLVIPIPISKTFFLLFLNTIKGNKLLLSRKNATQYLPLAQFLQNTELERSISILLNKNISPKEVISYILDQKKKHLSVLHDLRYIASHFKSFYRDPSFKLLQVQELKTICKCNKLSITNELILKQYYKSKSKQNNTLENYFIISTPITRNSMIELHCEPECELQGIIANLTALAGGNALIKRALFIHTPVFVKNIENVVDLQNPSKTIRIDGNGMNYILYDFRERQISLTSVTIQVGNNYQESPKHWSILGSNDSENWTVLLEVFNDSFLNKSCSLKNYPCQKSDFYRHIMFCQKKNFSKRKDTLPIINISAIEFFGTLAVI